MKLLLVLFVFFGFAASNWLDDVINTVKEIDPFADPSSAIVDGSPVNELLPGVANDTVIGPIANGTSEIRNKRQLLNAACKTRRRRFASLCLIINTQNAHYCSTKCDLSA